MKTTKGFTLVELVIVIIIVGILSVVAVPIYKGYTERAYMTEAKALLGTVNTAQKVYFAENRAYASTSSALGADTVDASGNKYFTSYTISGGGATFTATTNGTGSAAGMSLSLAVASNGTPTWSGTGE